MGDEIINEEREDWEAVRRAFEQAIYRQCDEEDRADLNPEQDDSETAGTSIP